MMREVLVLLVHLLARLAILLGTRGTRAVVAENLILKQQLLVIQRSRRRAPNLRPSDRVAGELPIRQPQAPPDTYYVGLLQPAQSLSIRWKSLAVQAETPAILW
jgi:hypothetical protein